MKKEYLGIDLGTDNTIIYSSLTNEIIFNEPTCIALERSTKKVKNIGILAAKIEGKTPYNIEIIHPIVNGLINDDDALLSFVKEIFEKLRFDKRAKINSIIFSAPSLCGKVNRKVIIELGKSLQAKEIYIEPQAKISAFATELNRVLAPNATLVCDIGAGVTDIALISMGEVVASNSTNIAGKTFSEAIRRYMIQKQHLSIGMNTAEYIKMRIGSIAEMNENKLVEVKGKDTITSLPSSIIISSEEIKNVLCPIANYIALKITDVIASVPSELVADITRNGLILTGGGALLSGMKDYLQKILSIPVKVLDNPLNASAEGFASYIRYLNELSK